MGGVKASPVEQALAEAAGDGGGKAVHVGPGGGKMAGKSGRNGAKAPRKASGRAGAGKRGKGGKKAKLFPQARFVLHVCSTDGEKYNRHATPFDTASAMRDEFGKKLTEAADEGEIREIIAVIREAKKPKKVAAKK